MKIYDSMHPTLHSIDLPHHLIENCIIYDVRWQVLKAQLIWSSPVFIKWASTQLFRYMEEQVSNQEKMRRVCRIQPYANRAGFGPLEIPNPFLLGDWDWNNVRIDLIALCHQDIRLAHLLRNLTDGKQYSTREGQYYKGIVLAVIARREPQTSGAFISSQAGAFCGHCNHWFAERFIVYGLPTHHACDFMPDHYCRACAVALNVTELIV
jgi:hypothetical protein